MTHRYGRHGKNAWLRWREKRLRRTSLALAPQIAVLHVPVEFLSRIRKVTILMSDGTEEVFQIPTNSLSSPIVESTTTKMHLNGSDQTENPQDEFYAVALATANDQADIAFRDEVDPYTVELDVQEAKRDARHFYYRDERLRQQLDWGKAQESFVNKFKGEFQRRLYKLSADQGASTEGIRQLLVSARKDKRADHGEIPIDAHDRTYMRAALSLFSDTPLCQEEINKDTLNNWRQRADLYQRFYKEFEPAKEED